MSAFGQKQTLLFGPARLAETFEDMFPIGGILVGVQMPVNFRVRRLDAYALGEGSACILDLT